MTIRQREKKGFKGLLFDPNDVKYCNRNKNKKISLWTNPIWTMYGTVAKEGAYAYVCVCV